MADLTREEIIAKVATGESLEGADLEGVDLQGAHLRGADLKGADLRKADLRGTDLKGADLHYTKLGSVNFRGAAYNKSTKFPKGFDPDKEEMMLVE